MRQITWNELSNSSGEVLDWLRHGNPVRIYQEGKPIADLVPVPPLKQPAWKRSLKRVNLPIGQLSTEILADREDAKA
jgi:antitoxin (DNA-binding transcriptional repressor) of toxin-antitoxin stability system